MSRFFRMPWIALAYALPTVTKTEVCRLSQLKSHQCIIDSGLLYCCRVSLLKERKNARGETVLDEGIGNTIGLDFASLCSTSCLRIVKSNRLKITSVGTFMQRLLYKSQYHHGDGKACGHWA